MIRIRSVSSLAYAAWHVPLGWYGRSWVGLRIAAKRMPWSSLSASQNHSNLGHLTDATEEGYICNWSRWCPRLFTLSQASFLQTFRHYSVLQVDTPALVTTLHSRLSPRLIGARLLIQTRIKDAGIAIRHSRAYIISILQRPERGWRGWTPVYTYAKSQKINHF